MIGNALRTLRILNDIKVCDMAVKLELSQSYVSELENGKKTVSLNILSKYGIIFNMTSFEVLTFSEELNKNKESFKADLNNMLKKFVKEYRFKD